MISRTIKQVVFGLNEYVNSLYNGTNPRREYVVMKHIGKNMTNNVSDEKVFVNLINVEEDIVYKNQMSANSITGNTIQSGAYPMRVNLYVLFAFNPGETNEEYSDSIELLNDVLRYFQSYRNMVVDFPPTPPYTLDINYHNVSLEDSNNLWSNMGAEQKPYAIFKFRLLEIQPISASLITSSQIITPQLIIDPT